MASLTVTLPQVLELAFSAYKAGEFGKAEQMCQQLISAKPDFFDALHLLAVAQSSLEKNDLALASYDRALAVRPNHADALSNRGNALKALKRFEEALASYDHALVARPDHADALNNRGLALHALGRYDDALASYDRALALRPNYAEALFNRGNTFGELRRFDEALVCYNCALSLRPNYAEVLASGASVLNELRLFDKALVSCERALALRPDYPEALAYRGLILHGLKRFDEALKSYDEALVLRPDYVDVFNNRGNVLRDLKRLDEALASYNRALALRPGYVDALNNRGVLLHQLKRLDEALANYDQALALRPNHPEALCNRGVTLELLKQYENALASCDRALICRPNYPEAHCNRGNTLKELKRFDEALASYERALVLRPDYAEVHWNEGLARLLFGDYERGWPKYEWRWENRSRALSRRNFEQPLWRGGEGLDGKTMLLYSEQGFGDTIQFSRYVPLVAARGARVILEVDRPLQGLMNSVVGATEVISRGKALPGFDLQCPLLSLPLAFGTRLETIPSETPYLQVPEQVLKEWQARLGPATRPRIGLTWSGNAAHRNDRNRSISLRSLLPLLDVGATFVSLQKEVRPEDAAVLKDRADILDFGDALRDFTDTAALISQLDLVISVDTSVAHLAGAMAKPVWLLLTYVPDWRWLLDREDSPWYPTARLFRQDETRTWDGVIKRANDALEKLLRTTYAPMERNG
jgi:tetratricopeptide (TPR) repeat protein